MYKMYHITLFYNNWLASIMSSAPKCLYAIISDVSLIY